MDYKTILLSILSSLYLIYMFFFYKTKYHFGQAKYEKETQHLGTLFVHDTGNYENKVCVFGKIMAVIAILLATIRLYIMNMFPEYNMYLLIFSLIFNCICLFLAFNMNLTAFVYLVPLIITELYFVYLLWEKKTS